MTDPIIVSGGPAKSSRKRLYVLVGGAVVALLVAVVLPKVMFSDETSGELAAEVPEADVTTTPAAPAQPVEPAKLTSSKNPFTPLAAPAEAGSAEDTAVIAVPTDSVTPAYVVPSSTSTTPSQSTPTTTPPPSSGNDGDDAPTELHTIKLVSIELDGGGNAAAVVNVNGTEASDLHVLDVFGKNFLVLQLDATTGCGAFLYGDLIFPLCVSPATP